MRRVALGAAKRQFHNTNGLVQQPGLGTIVPAEDRLHRRGRTLPGDAGAHGSPAGA
jgi:hypothetical protein